MRLSIFWLNLLQILSLTGFISVTLSPLNAQEKTSEWVLTDVFHEILGFIFEDDLGNKYSIEGGGLVKIFSDNQTVSYSNRQLGNITHTDISDPLNIVVFFGESGSVAILDKNLTIKTLIGSESFMSGIKPAAVCSTPGKGLWLWFPDVFRILRFDFRLQPNLSSDDLSQSGLLPVNVSKMIFKDDKLILAAENGIWVFDQFANLLRFVPLIIRSDFQVLGNYFFYLDGNRFIAYDFFLGEENVFLLPDTKVKGFFLKDNRTIYLQTDISLKKYNISGNFF